MLYFRDFVCVPLLKVFNELQFGGFAGQIQLGAVVYVSLDEGLPEELHNLSVSCSEGS